MDPPFGGGLLPEHPDYVLMKRLEHAILRHAGGLARFRTAIPPLLRQAIDEAHRRAAIGPLHIGGDRENGKDLHRNKNRDSSTQSLKDAKG